MLSSFPPFSVEIIILSSLKFSVFEIHVITYRLLQPLLLLIVLPGSSPTMTSDGYYLGLDQTAHVKGTVVHRTTFTSDASCRLGDSQNHPHF